MKRVRGTRKGFGGGSEFGGARLNFLIVIFVLAVLAYVGSQYAPVAYNATLFKDSMQQTVNIAAGTGKPVEWVRTQIRASADDYAVPPDALINVQQKGGRIEAQVRWTRPIPLPGYIYQYNFDHTVRSNPVLTQN